MQIIYQLKNMRRDKLCVLTFLLPVFAGIAICFMSDIDFRSLGEIAFGCVQDELPQETVTWLQDMGSLTEYQTIDELEEAVNHPSTQMIGVRPSEIGIRTILSGDELKLYDRIGKTLSQLYNNRTDKTRFIKTIIPAAAENDGLKFLLIAITLMTAMFMGCIFNAMNIIGEKEDGIAFVNQILPMTTQTYIVQKLLLGFIGGTVSAVITAFICMQIGFRQIIPCLFLVILSAYIASLAGLFIGHFSSGLMIGIVYIKIIMILFLAPPIVFYLIIPADSMIYPLSYLFPSSAAFYGVMELLGGQREKLLLNLAVLFIHAVLWSCLYFFCRRNRNFRKMIIDS